MKNYGIFSATERVLMEAVKRGADRQKMHEVIRSLCLKAWDDVQTKGINNLKEDASADENLLKYLSKDEIADLLDASSYIGEAAERTEAVVQAATNPR